jgi:hypothetical protein
MIRSTFTKIFLSILLLISLSRCAPAPVKGVPLTSAQEKLQTILRGEHKIETVLKAFDNTLWIYVPLERNFFQTKASEKNDQGDPKQATESPSIYFLDGKFAENKFVIEYDIGKSRKYTQDYGYDSTYTEEYNTTLRQIFQTITRAYGSAQVNPDNPLEFFESIPGDVEMDTSHQKLVQSYAKTTRVPTFFVIVLADIKSGIEARALITFADLRRAMQDTAFYEEYTRRSVFETPGGNPQIIDDREGKYINYHDISWGEFLTRQIIYRINFKYSRSSLPPSDNPKLEILKVGAETVNGYQFNDFSGIELRDLYTSESLLVGKDRLKEYLQNTPQ